MGKGDKKTKRGKIARRSYGKSRPRKPKKKDKEKEKYPFFMNHLVAYEIQKVTCCPYRLLFDENYVRENLKTSDEFNYSNIYMFCRQKKVRFNMEKTQLINKRTLKTELIIGNSKNVEVEASLFDLSLVFKDVYKTKEQFEYLVSDDDDFWRCEILKDKSDEAMLHFNQVATKENQRFDFFIAPENFEFDLDLDLNNPPEIVYIGQSFRMLDRIQSHKTLHEAISKLKGDEDLKIFFFTFKYGYGGHKDLFNHEGDVFKTWLSQHGKTDKFKLKIDLVERFLIHYFKPIYNKQHVDCEIENDPKVKELLVKNKIETVMINYGIYGNGFQIWSPKQKLKRDFVSFNFNEPTNGYY